MATKKFSRLTWALILLAEALLFAAVGFYFWARDDYVFFGPERPDILFIMVDTLRSDRLHCYGHPLETSPTLDRLAREGALFENVISQAPWTKPSLASLFTSTSCSTHGVIHYLKTPQAPDETALTLRFDRLPDAYLTLAEALQAAGYRTVAFSANWWMDPAFGFGQGFDEFYSLAYGKPPGEKNRAVQYTNLPASVLNQKFQTWLRLNGLDQKRWLERLGLHRRPFFAYLHYMDVHGPYRPPPPFDQTFDSHYFALPAERIPAEDRAKLDYLDLGTDLLNLYQSRYDGQILYFDTQLQKLLDALAAAGLLDQCLIVFTADHGESLGEHRTYGHGDSLYQAEIHVPLILWSPSLKLPPSRIPGYLPQLDLAPTLLELLHLPAPSEFQGRSRVPRLRGQPEESPEIWSENFKNNVLEYTRIKNSQKWIFTAAEMKARVLYDLGNDPREDRNLLPGLAPEAIARAEAEARKWRQARESERLERGMLPAVELSDEAREALKALGYLK